ncbi:MAG: hypothetical protein AAF551_11360 [Bacteroidota bacterium]
MISCTGKSEKNKESEGASRDSAPTTNSEFYINTIDNERLASISLTGERSLLTIGTKSYWGTLKTTEKRKYYDANDELAYIIKYGEAGFKLKDENDQLRWKVKLTDEYIKIANNEEMENTYRVSRSSKGKIKVKQHDKELAVIPFVPNNHSIEIGKRYYLINFGHSLAIGVMMLEDMPLLERFLLSAEILRLVKLSSFME